MNEPRHHFLEGRPRLHFLEWNPDGSRTIVLLHGNSANAWWWNWVAKALGREFRLLAIDQRGHGDSQWVSPPAYTPHDYAGDLGRFIREVLGGERPLVAGHSMGGMSVVAFASLYPQSARAAVAIDIAISSSRMRDRYLMRLRALPTVVYPDLETAKARFRLMPEEGKIPRERVSAIAEKSLGQTAGGGYTLKFDRECFFGGDGLHVLAALRTVRIPMMLVRAERSRIMTQEAAEAACASNPRTRLVVIPGAHHHLPLEKPVELARLIEQFARAAGG